MRETKQANKTGDFWKGIWARVPLGARLVPMLGVLSAMQGSSQGIDIQFDYSFDTNNFFVGHSDRQAVLEAAALTFESRITDNLTAITPGGSNSWTAVFPNPATGVTSNVSNPTISADVIRVYAGARDLGSSTLGIGGPGGFNAGGSQSFLDNLSLRGQVSGTTDFGPWGGAITFDIDRAWYFDPDPSTLENFGITPDFYSVALHELAHLLGFGTADSWDHFVSDMTFTGSASIAEFGTPVPLNAQESHWAEGTDSHVTSPLTLASQEAAMDPTIFTGTRKYFTELDFAALDDVGWQVIPEPGTALLLVSGIAFAVSSRRRRRSS